jgi:hypothetical protein
VTRRRLQEQVKLAGKRQKEFEEWLAKQPYDDETE